MAQPLDAQRRQFKQAWGAIDETEDPGYFVRYLDRFGGGDADDPARYGRYVELLQARAGQRLLDVGCGLGGLVRALGRVVGPGGRVVGVDNSATLLAEAGRRADGRDLPVEYRVADAHRLPFADGTFDGCCATGVFEVVADPRRALAELARVARPGGRVVVTVADFGTAATDATDRDVTRRIHDYWTDREANGWIGRQLPGLFREAGLAEVTVVPTTHLVPYATFSWILASTGWLERAQAAGVVTPAEVEAWLADLAERERAERFLNALTVFTVAGRKP